MITQSPLPHWATQSWFGDEGTDIEWVHQSQFVEEGVHIEWVHLCQANCPWHDLVHDITATQVVTSQVCHGLLLVWEVLQLGIV